MAKANGYECPTSHYNFPIVQWCPPILGGWLQGDSDDDDDDDYDNDVAEDFLKPLLMIRQ